MSKKINNVGTLNELKEESVRMFERTFINWGVEASCDFKIGVMLQEARLKKGLTQQELADKVGTTKSYISKIENSVKEARISTLEKIVELGFGGKLELKIKIN